MAEKETYVPLLKWLIGGSRIGGSYNTYIGSIGTDPQKGCLASNIKNYRIWIEKLEETEVIRVAVYFGMNSYDNQNPDDVVNEVFEMSDESIALIRNWIDGINQQ